MEWAVLQSGWLQRVPHYQLRITRQCKGCSSWGPCGKMCNEALWVLQQQKSIEEPRPASYSMLLNSKHGAGDAYLQECAHTEIRITCACTGDLQNRGWAGGQAGELRAPKRTMFQARWRNGARNTHTGTPVTSGIPLNPHYLREGTETLSTEQWCHMNHTERGVKSRLQTRSMGTQWGGGGRGGRGRRRGGAQGTQGSQAWGSLITRWLLPSPGSSWLCSILACPQTLGSSSRGRKMKKKKNFGL